MFDLNTLITTVGYIGIFIIVFAESGFLLGFFLPGDSLLFTAGLLASQGHFNVWILLILTIVGAILGDSLGYATGKIIGPRIFTKEESLFFKKKYIDDTQQFFLTYGAKALVLARFMPIVRTFTPIMAGVGKMNYSVFVFYNIAGGILWCSSFLLSSYFLGTLVPGIEHYVTYIIGAIIIISILPIALKFFRKQKISKDKTRGMV